MRGLGRVPQCLVQHVIEAHRVHKQAFINPLDVLVRHLGVGQLLFVEAVPGQRSLVSRLDEDARDLEVLGI